jgi:hypothetical protein
VGDDVYAEFMERMKGLTESILTSDVLPYPNPMGLTRPA